METKSKIVKTAKVCYIVAKVLYCVAFAVCLIFIALAIALSLTDAIEAFTPAETAIIFATAALYAFMCIGLLWNVEGLFKSIAKEGTPFCDAVSHYLKKIAVFILLTAIIPALLGTTVLKIACPESEFNFPVEVGGIVAGGVLFLVGLCFQYGKELQERDDETL